MARNLRTSLISGGFGNISGRRAAITPFGSAPMSSSIVPPTPNVFSNTATTVPPVSGVPAIPPPSPKTVISTGPQLPPNPQQFQFGNPFNDLFNATSVGDTAAAATAEAESEDTGESEGESESDE